MKAAGAFLLALFLGSMTLLAQAFGRKNTQAVVVHPPQAGASCPVDIEAQRQINDGTLASTQDRLKADRQQGVAQRLQLTLNNPAFREVVGIRITVRGFDSKGRVAPAEAARTDVSEIEKTLDLPLKVAPKSEASTEILLPAFTSVRSIDLDSVRYAGGSAWRPSAMHACQVFPDAMMLISKR